MLFCFVVDFNFHMWLNPFLLFHLWTWEASVKYWLMFSSFSLKLTIHLVFSRFNMDIRHIKITSCEGLYRINDKKAFRGLIVSFKQESRSYAWDFQHAWCWKYQNAWCLFLLTILYIIQLFFLPSLLGNGWVLPEEFSERILQGRGHNAAHPL